MRLLRLEDSGEFSPVEFVGKNIPPYAILSHTWGEDHEEVTLKDLVDSAGKSKAGYGKIQFCAKQAAKDGLQYVWVDTCCINKSSSAELSEAINSMFRWYYSADKCYVYLADVALSSSVRNNHSSKQTWKSAFQQSRWFTRGWTLQELIAPSSIEFFSVEGERLGDRNSLVQEIHKTTGITVQALQRSPLSHFSVDTRMAWAAGRETKREEDAAYSLLGIFNIHMPLIYGEGRNKAFSRLYREIRDSAQESTPLLPPPISPPQVLVPTPEEEYLKDREREDAKFSRLEGLLIAQQEARIQRDREKTKARIQQEKEAAEAAKAAETKRKYNEEQITRLENIMFTLKEYQYKSEAAYEVWREAENDAADKKTTEEAAEKKAVTEARKQAEKRVRKAIDLEAQVMEISVSVLGLENPFTLTRMVDLASAYKNNGQFRKAEELEARTMELSKRVLGENHLDTLTSMANLAFTWKFQGLDNKALALMEECFRLRTLSLGSDHPHTVSSLNALNEWKAAILGFDSEVVWLSRQAIGEASSVPERFAISTSL